MCWSVTLVSFCSADSGNDRPSLQGWAGPSGTYCVLSLGPTGSKGGLGNSANRGGPGERQGICTGHAAMVVPLGSAGGEMWGT